MAAPAATVRDTALSIHNRAGGGLRSATWHYMKYGDKGEELYDMVKDPHQYKNLVNNPEYATVLEEARAKFKQRMAAAYIPENVYHSPVSKHLLTLFNELQLVSLLLSTIFALLLFDRYIVRWEKRRQGSVQQNEIPYFIPYISSGNIIFPSDIC